MVDTSNSVNPGASAELISAYAPTAISIRVIGCRDQKFAPRVACSEVILSSTVGSGSVIQSQWSIRCEAVELAQHRRHIVGKNEH